MTVKLLLDWKDSRDGKQYKAGNLLTTDSYTENGLVASKQADTNLTGGTAYVAPTTQAQLVNLYGQVDPVTGKIGFLIDGVWYAVEDAPVAAADYHALISARSVDKGDATILDKSGKGKNATLGAQCVAATVYGEAGTTGLFVLAACGSSNEQTLNIPAPPKRPNKRAPPLGKRSATTPIIVGQKNVLPNPKIVAATKTIPAVVA